MIRTVTILCLFSVVCCQYQRQRSPPYQERPPARDQPQPEEIYEPPPQTAFRPPPPPARHSSLLRPASVHYVNIGEELAGDYKFGYDTGRGDDGQSFREETRLPDGTVQGAYGYVDDTGKQRIVKYTAGLEGFKIIGDDAADKAPRSAAPRPAAPRSAPPQPAPQPQPAYRAPPPAESYQPPPQPAYRAPAQPQPAHRAPAQPAYRPAPQPEYRAPPQPAYRAPPAPQRSYEPEPQSYAPRSRPQSQAPRRQYSAEPVQRSRDSEPDYDYPENDITERRIVPIDTSLFNYNIGTHQGDKK